MLSKEQENLLAQLESGFSRDHYIWLSGYAAGKAGLPAGDIVTQATGPQVSLAIFFATETGNAKMVSQQLVKAAKGAGMKANAKPISRIGMDDLKKHDGPLVFVLATHGEGDPPEMAHKWFDALKAAPDGLLEGKEFATCGLGDKSYEIFCGFARNVDVEMARLGAKPVIERKELDVDFASHTDGWISELVSALKPAGGAVATSVLPTDDAPTIHTGRGYSRLEPVKGTIKEHVNLNDHGSNKETYHIEIAFDEALAYQPGDALGIIMPVKEGEKEETPRLYSIASSPLVHENEVHITVALAWHVKEDGSKGYGTFSHYLSQLKEGDEVSCYIQQNHQFRLPPLDRDIIMVGPGTGVAPFRSFVFEREEQGAEGRNWLFFGEQHAHLDFLYQAEWIDHVASEALDRIDLAFSRDQAEKVYVQDKMRDKADTLFEWLEGGAYFYVCGSKDPMSKDVDAVLREIIAARKGGDEAAEAYIADLEDAGRYVKDVY